jgi:putative membrane protein insertion efficiency factor
MKRFVIMILRLYQGWSVRRVPVCRFHPSCSQYTLEAVERHGALRGGWLGVRRVIRCRPGGGFGFDPVPQAEHSAECVAPEATLETVSRS